MTAKSSRRLDAFDQWCLRRIHSYESSSPHRVTNQEVHRTSAQPSVTQTINARRLRLFGHIVRSNRTRVPSSPASTTGRRTGDGLVDRPGVTWLRTIDQDIKQLNLGYAISPAQCSGSCCLAPNRGNSHAALAACYMTMMMTCQLCV